MILYHLSRSIMTKSTTEASSCPICWHDLSSDAVQGPCGHGFCRPCLERVLLAASIPTQGLCPMCRQSLSLFDLKQQQGEALYPLNPDLSEITPLIGAAYSLRNQEHHNRSNELWDQLPDKITFGEQGPFFDDNTENIVKYQWHNPSRTIRFLNSNSDPMVLSLSCDWRTILRACCQDKVLLGSIYRQCAGETMYAPLRSPPSYHSTTVFGNTFCQAMMVGLASYHFVSETESYISYEHSATAMWGTLDNGLALPSRAPFRNVTVEDRVFRGQICWWNDFGSTWHGMKQWDYEIHFDEQFYTILRGQVHSITAQDHRTEMSEFGETLLYCNAALFDVFRALDYREASLQLRESLQRQGATVRTMALLHSLLTSAHDGRSNPIDFNLS